MWNCGLEWDEIEPTLAFANPEALKECFPERFPASVEKV
jgi:hypothetical protein